ncbi:hypothetical protein SNE40_023307 [Patella caerulea]|uniref:Uncharacterized protein n=1 Tax=Patella caerulea TaxID=87958 RepID=A0AAN8J096_PATCE
MKNILILFVLIESNSLTTLAGYCNDLEIKSCKRYDDEYGKITNPTLAQYCSTVFKIVDCLKGCDEALRKYKAGLQKLYASYGGYFSCDQLSDTEKIDSCKEQEVDSCTSIFSESFKINKSTSDQVCS